MNHEVDLDTPMTLRMFYEQMALRNDPAQTEAAVHRAMSAYAPAIVQGVVNAAEHNRNRLPISQ